ncbi:MAG: hypothetical protein COA42_20205 [Alteromonadaceae bacterium]|nr:MAG: hypothetical protein COA42_20205 [Alteromonadaceae bacterium]
MKTNDKRIMSIRNEQGLGLIELMISVVIGAFILGGVFQLHATSRANSMVGEGTSRIQENVRYIFSQIEDDASQTGNFGCFAQTFVVGSRPGVGSILGSNKAIGSDGETVAIEKGHRYFLDDMIYGTDGAVDDGSDPMAQDEVVFRYASRAAAIPVDSYKVCPDPDTKDEVFPQEIELDISALADRNTYGTLDQYEVALIGDCRAAVYMMITNDPSADIDIEAGIGTVKFEFNTYAPEGHYNEFLGNEYEGLDPPNSSPIERYTPGVEIPGCGGSNDSSRARPYLYAGRSAYTYSIKQSAAGKELGVNCSDEHPEYCALFRDSEEMAEGVEQFQVAYGWQPDGGGGTLMFGTADAVEAAGAWNDVDRLRITVTLNSVENAKLGGDSGSSRLLTKTITRTIAIRNQIQN